MNGYYGRLDHGAETIEHPSGSVVLQHGAWLLPIPASCRIAAIEQVRRPQRSCSLLAMILYYLAACLATEDHPQMLLKQETHRKLRSIRLSYGTKYLSRVTLPPTGLNVFAKEQGTIFNNVYSQALCQKEILLAALKSHFYENIKYPLDITASRCAEWIERRGAKLVITFEASLTVRSAIAKLAARYPGGISVVLIFPNVLQANSEVVTELCNVEGVAWVGELDAGSIHSGLGGLLDGAVFVFGASAEFAGRWIQGGGGLSHVYRYLLEAGVPTCCVTQSYKEVTVEPRKSLDGCPAHSRDLTIYVDGLHTLVNTVNSLDTRVCWTPGHSALELVRAEELPLATACEVETFFGMEIPTLRLGRPMDEWKPNITDGFELDEGFLLAGRLEQICLDNSTVLINERGSDGTICQCLVL